MQYFGDDLYPEQFGLVLAQEPLVWQLSDPGVPNAQLPLLKQQQRKQGCDDASTDLPLLAKADHDAKARAAAAEKERLRYQRMRETNIRAQRKFRSKQKLQREERQQYVDLLAEELAQAEREKSAAAERHAQLEAQLQPQEAWALPESERMLTQLGGKGVLFSAVFGTPRKLTRHQAIRLGLDEYCDIWKEVAARAGELLHASREDPTSLSGIALQMLLKEWQRLNAVLATLNPTLIHRLVIASSFRKASGPKTRRSSPLNRNNPCKLLALLHLRPCQRTAMLDARSTYLAETSRQLDARGRLRGVLVGVDMGEWRESQAWVAGREVLWAEGVRELADTVDLCHAHFCAYHSAHWSSALGLDCFQEAKMLTNSFPLLPDLLALANVLAAEEGAPDDYQMSAAAFSAEAVRELPLPGSSDTIMPPVPLDEKLWSYMELGRRLQ